jgi:class 3 adenylate cyclase
MKDTPKNRPPSPRLLARVIREYLAEAPGAGEKLRLLLDQSLDFDGDVQLTRRIKTSLLFTDIAGSTAMFDQYGDRYGRSIVAIHDRIVDSVVEARGGVRVKHTGDGMLASFASCGRSVKAAILIQRQVARHSAKFPLLAFKVKIGVNVGSVIRGASDLFGSSVNLAARLCDMAAAGGILTTGIVHSRCKGKGYEFRNPRTITFKGLRKEVPVYDILWHPGAMQPYPG